MVNKIWSIKNKVLEHMENEIKERGGIERTDIEKMDKLANIVHHLAESEASCWEAEYYRNTVSQMEKNSSGYGAGTGSSAGYGMRQGYGMPEPSYEMGRSGYMDAKGGDDVAAALSRQLQEASPDEREHLRNKYMGILGRL